MNLQDKSTKLNAELQETLDLLSSKKVEELSFTLDDLNLLKEAMSTLMMYIFGDPKMTVNGHAGQIEIYNEDAEDIKNGMVVTRKLQRLFDLIGSNADICNIGLSFNKYNL